MTQRKWLTVGLKLLGVYFAVQGAINLSAALAVGEGELILPAIVYGAVSFALTRSTDWCLELIDPDGADPLPLDPDHAP